MLEGMEMNFSSRNIRNVKAVDDDNELNEKGHKSNASTIYWTRYFNILMNSGGRKYRNQV